MMLIKISLNFAAVFSCGNHFTGIHDLQTNGRGEIPTVNGVNMASKYLRSGNAILIRAG